MYINYKEGDGRGGAIIWDYYLFIDCPKTWWCDVPNKVVQNYSALLPTSIVQILRIKKIVLPIWKNEKNN